MANSQRTRLAIQAWRDHLITAPEAMEISGVESESEMLACAARRNRESSDDGADIQD
jgi:hypothetical protein